MTTGEKVGGLAVSYRITQDSPMAPESIVICYDTKGFPVYQNIYFTMLINDDLPIPGLVRLFFLGGGSKHLPKEIVGFVSAYLSNIISEAKSPLSHSYRKANPEVASKMSRLLELKGLLANKKIEPVDGWIGFRVEGSKIRAAAITRTEEEIKTDVKYFDITGKWKKQQDLLKLSDEYRNTLLWLYENHHFRYL